MNFDGKTRYSQALAAQRTSKNVNQIKREPPGRRAATIMHKDARRLVSTISPSRNMDLIKIFKNKTL
jgi:hypothetical protein